MNRLTARDILAALYTLGYFFTVAFVLKNPAVLKEPAAASIFTGLSGGEGYIIAYYFGSSEGSMVKNYLLNKGKDGGSPDA